jgi:hypothetical protein
VKVGRLMFVLVMLSISARAHADTVLDFTSASYGVAHGQQTFATVDQGIGVSVEASAGSLWNDAVDGFGIMDSGSYEADEIEGDEQLVLRFAEAVTVTGFSLTDLFVEHALSRGTACPLPGCYAEFGAAMFHYQDGTHSLWSIFQGVQVFGTNGVLDVAVHQSNVIAMTFMAPGVIAGDFLQDHEFSLASVTVQAIPEPATWLLIVTGISAIVARRRT